MEAHRLEPTDHGCVLWSVDAPLCYIHFRDSGASGRWWSRCEDAKRVTEHVLLDNLDTFSNAL